jgi:gliding motility-associated-like protein
MLLTKRNLFALMLACISVTAFSQLQITSSVNAQALAQKLVGGGVTISNVTITGHGFSSAFFKNLGGNQLNVDSGIVLSTGRVQTSGLPGLNGPAGLFASTGFGFPGDASLNALVTPNLTEDAVYLEFDFVPIGDTIRFNYVFSSEEYPGFSCTQFNDVFAFFISGPGISGSRNIALVPGTNIPVAINSINSGTASDNNGFCSGMGAGSPFPQYFTNNISGASFTHDGHTKVLTAMSPVTPCLTYHLKIAIADVSDDIYDSAVFLEAESLRSDPIKISTTLPVLNGLPYLVEGCQSGVVEILRSRKTPNALNVNLVFGGNAINGIDFQNIPSVITIPANDSLLVVPIVPVIDNVPEGTDTLKIYVSNGCQASGNFYQDSITILLRDYDTLSIAPNDSTVCNNSSIQLNAGGNFGSIQWTPSSGLSNANIANPVAVVDTSITYIATATTGTCQARDSVVLRIKSLRLISKTDINCKNGTTGEIKLAAGGAWQQPAQFNINNNAFGTDSVFTNLPVGTYTVRVKDASGCIDSMQVTLVQAYPDLVIGDSIITASCTGVNGKVFLSAVGGLAPYSYQVNGAAYGTTSAFTVNGGSHTIYVKDSNGCISSKPIAVNNDPVITFTTQPSQILCNGSPSGYLYINANGGDGQYQYSIDGTNFQTPDSFLVSTANVNITVMDSKGCTATGSVAIPINQPVFIDLGSDPNICEGSTYQFNPSYNANTFTWNTNSTLSGTGIPNPVASPTATTTYYVTVTKDVCVARDTITVNVWKAPIANAGPDSTICSGRTINLTGSGGTVYTWLPASAVPTPNVSNPSVKPTQTTSYYLQVTDGNGCKSLQFDTVKITLTPPIQAFAGNDTSVAIGQPLQLLGMDLGNSGASIYEWSPAQGLNNPDIANPIATLNADITYTLKLSTAEGCEGTDQITIKVFMTPEIYVPTGFTPNGDGKNDFLRAMPVGIKKFNYFRVFNRWGQMVFSTSSERQGWDGKISGKVQSTEVFIWIAEGVDFTGNKIFRKGTTILIR